MDRLKKIVCIALSVVLLTGCGGRYLSPGEGGTVSGGAVSGGSVAEDVVSGSSVDGEESTESTGTGISGKFCTDTNLYFVHEVEVDEDDEVVQTRLDGTHAQKIKLKGFYSLIGVADGWLYYENCTESDEINICRVPIRKENGYDRVETDRVERLVEDDFYEEKECLAGDSLYYFYPVYPESEYTIERLDLKTGKRDSWPMKEMGADISFIEAGKRVYAATDIGLYTQQSNEPDWTLLSDSSLGNIGTGTDIQVCTEKACYYGRIDDTWSIPELRRINAETGADTLFISEESLCGSVRNSEEFEGDKEFSAKIENVYYDEGRIWILALISWMESGVYHMEYRVFSRGEEETGLRYEEELTGCMHDHSSVRTGKEKKTDDKGKKIIAKENVEINEGCLYAVESGRAFMALYDGKKKEYRVGYCEIGTGKFYWLTNRDPIFYGPAVSGKYQGDAKWESFYSEDPYKNDGLGFVEKKEICNIMYHQSGEDGFFVESN